MPSSETPDQRQSRRAAVRVICRLSTALPSADVLSKDVGATLLSERVARLRSALDGQELESLEEAVRQYEEATGGALPVPMQPFPNRVREPPRQRFRVHGADVQLTFNETSWIADGEDVDAWFQQAGVRLAARFQGCALEEFPRKFRERVLHTSLTLEQSCRASDGQSRVHLHAQFTIAGRIDRTGVSDFVFDGVYPHIVAWH